MPNITTLHRLLTLWALGCVPWSLAWAQDSAPGQAGGAVPAATAPSAQNPENPPLSGLDVPTNETPFVGRSFFIPGIQIAETVSSNGYGQGQTLTAISRGLGSLDLQKIWRRYQVDLDYVGGGSYYTGPNPPGFPRGYQTHSLGLDQRFRWRTGQMTIRDNFSYLPEGSFGFGSYGGFGDFSSALGGGALSGVGLSSGLGGGLAGGIGGGGGIYGGGTYGSIGIQPRIDNLTVVDISQGLSPRSTITLGGGYDFNTYLDKSRSAFPLINGQQLSGQIGYDRLLSRRDQIALVASYQQLQFPGAGGGGIRAYAFQGMYGRRINGRLNFVIAGGPQFVTINSAVIRVANGLFLAIPSTTSVGGTGSVSVGYTLSARSDLSIDYQHYLTAGSGFYAGANTDAARATVNRILNRNWTLATDGGYSYSTPLQSHLNTGINATSYQYWYIGGSLRRTLGQHFDLFVDYQYDAFTAGSCTSANGSRAVCGHTPATHIGTFGLNWHPRPIRLD